MKELLSKWLDSRTGISSLVNNICNFSVPKRNGICRFFPAMIVFAFLLQVITGILLWVFYSPSAQTAWESLFYIQFMLPGGWLIRGIHNASAQILTGLLGFYVLGLVFSGRYRSPREFVFWTGFVLLLFSLASSLTGDLLSWTLSGFSATLVRVRFLQMLPFIGEPLFRIVAGGAEFGTLTIPRFLVLHILVFGGGFFAVMILWRFFDHRASTIEAKENQSQKLVSFWSHEALGVSLVCLLVMTSVLFIVYRKPILNGIRPDWFPLQHTQNHLPLEASRGVTLGAPADPSTFYDAARPEWSFRALYQFSNLKRKSGDAIIDVFPGEQKYIPIFVVTGFLTAYIFAIPIIGRLKIGHFFNMLAMASLFCAFCYLTFASYYHDYVDENMASFRSDEAQAARIAERTIELCLSGISPEGALALQRRDPLLQGPVLFERHCAICHPFEPMDGELVSQDFQPIPCTDVRAPNLYEPIRKKWIAGFLDPKRIRSDDYFGKTKFVSGTMVGYVRGGLRDILDEDHGNEKLLDELIGLLHEESLRNAPRIETPRETEGLSRDQLDIFATFDCGQCHKVYGQTSKPVIQAPDLRGYMSRDWMIGIIADPVSTRFYGPAIGKDKGNDDMPSFYISPDQAIMTYQEIETLVDWLRGKWYRFEKINGTKLESTPTENSGNAPENPNSPLQPLALPK